MTRPGFDPLYAESRGGHGGDAGAIVRGGGRGASADRAGLQATKRTEWVDELVDQLRAEGDKGREKRK